MSNDFYLSDNPNDPEFIHEQQHLSQVYDTLCVMAKELVDKMKQASEEAAADKLSLREDIAPNFATYADAFETYADYATINQVIDAYNASQSIDAEKLEGIRILLRQPYFAKVQLQFRPDEQPKELYIGAAGASDNLCRRLVVDWRSPVAEVYYNQENGRTSYTAHGRTIEVDLKLRRQFELTENVLHAFFDTTVAIQDALLLSSLAKQRSAKMQAITATIQKEQNKVIRHEDVPVLLVSGIAGSGKTSVLMQRIAYLFYQRRNDLKPEQVYLLTPNQVFTKYIDNVLPDMGEKNPHCMTWTEFAESLMPAERSGASAHATTELLQHIDRASKQVIFEFQDFKEIRLHGERLISAAQIAQVAKKFKRIPAGPHLAALMREELLARIDTRLAQLSTSEAIQSELSLLTPNEQIALFHETFNPHDEDEVRQHALSYTRRRFEPARKAVENDEWLRIDRIGKRLLGEENLSAAAWLYLKCCLTGLSNPDAQYVMIDEVQDYTVAQLMVLARYFRRAHFLLLGDKNQAITDGTARFEEVREVFSRMRGEVSICHLTTSYRSTPPITNLFASLLPEQERMNVSSVHREEELPTFIACKTRDERNAHLRRIVREVQENLHEELCSEEKPRQTPTQTTEQNANQTIADSSDSQNNKTLVTGQSMGVKADISSGLVAIIVPYKQRLKEIAAELEGCSVHIVDGKTPLPDKGVVITTLKLAKGLEFDQVILPNVSEVFFPNTPLARRQLYTSISRATKKITIMCVGKCSPLLEKAFAESASKNDANHTA